MLASTRSAPAGPRVIEEGSLVAVYESRTNMKCVCVKRGARYDSRYGNFMAQDWLGLPYGSKVFDKKGKGFVHLLELTPELWTRILLHRTQILYLPDISMIVAHMELRPGSVVLESGTGSGSLTTSLVAPTGRVYSFEYHEQRAETARSEFLQNGLSGVVTVFTRDTMGTGFPENLRGRADGVFLDLPGPHQVAKSGVASLRPNGWLCSFSPCIEQVQKMCLALADEGMVEFRTVEVLDREYDILKKHTRPFGERAPAPSRHRGGAGGAAAAGKKRGREEPSAAADGTASAGDAADASAGEAAGPASGGHGHGHGSGQYADVVQAFPQESARGHTGYLTFARKPVHPPGGGGAGGAAAAAGGAAAAAGGAAGGGTAEAGAAASGAAAGAQ